MATFQKITPNLWFDDQAEDAVKFYTSIFKNSGIGRISRYGKAGKEVHGMKEGTVMLIEFQLEGQNFTALNGGPVFKFNEAMSLVINCENQQEIDYYWDRLTPGGDEKSQVCGWLKDKYGVSWQVVPTAMAEMMIDSDQEKKDRVMNELLKMKKLDLEQLKHAFEGVPA